jgi:hypothetical protein
MGSTTTQGRPTTRIYAAGRVAFRYLDDVGALIADFRSSIPSPSFPLFTPRWAFRNVQCKTRGRADCYSFLVRLFHPHFHAGLSRRTEVFVSQQRFLIDQTCDIHDKGLSRENTHLLHSRKESPEASPWSRQWPVDFYQNRSDLVRPTQQILKVRSIRHCPLFQLRFPKSS